MQKIWTGKLTESPLGVIWVAVSDQGLVSVSYGNEASDLARRRGFVEPQLSFERTSQALQQIEEYLQGERQKFTLSIDWTGLTPFQKQILEATCNIPFGETTTYKALALQAGKPRAARAVGRAQALNPMPLVIPCHRVVGTDGGLHGYNGPQGVQTKAWLLAMERRVRSGGDLH